MSIFEKYNYPEFSTEFHDSWIVTYKKGAIECPRAPSKTNIEVAVKSYSSLSCFSNINYSVISFV